MSDARAPGALARQGRPARALALSGIALAPLAGFVGWQIEPEGLTTSLAIFGAGLAFAVSAMARGYPHDRLGTCNAVTALRLALAAALGAALMGDRGAEWSIFALALIVLSLDGVDGWFARREGVASEFGARFDMEVDAVLAAILSLVLLTGGRGGPELLILGGARYAFVAASLVLPWLSAPLSPSFWRKAVCVFQIGTLAVLSAPILPDGAARPLALLAAALVVWSFARDIRRLAADR